MNEYGELLDDSTVKFERVLPGPIERVWSFLTESDKRAQWLCGGDVETTLDGKVDMHFHNKSLSSEEDIPRPEKYRDMPEKMSFAGTVTRCEPPHILEHTWEFGEELSQVGADPSAAGNYRHGARCEWWLAHASQCARGRTHWQQAPSFLQNAAAVRNRIPPETGSGLNIKKGAMSAPSLPHQISPNS